MQTFLRDGRWLTAEEVEAYNTSKQSVESQTTQIKLK
jgi:hypothetical protein